MEAVYYRVLGGRTGFILRVFTLEGTLLGLASGALALLFSQGITWSIAAWQLDIPYRPYWLQSFSAVSAVTALTVVVCLAASRRVLRERPAHHLREREE
jgi:putative ABC transport system permease protein